MARSQHSKFWKKLPHVTASTSGSENRSKFVIPEEIRPHLKVGDRKIVRKCGRKKDASKVITDTPNMNER